VTHPSVLLRELETRAKRRLGQNFLVDPTRVAAIVAAAGVGEGSRVLEIGTGLGALTEGLLAAGAAVTGVEKDALLADFLQERLPAVRVIQGDALQVDLAEICPGSGWRCVANLPYNVATPLVIRMLGMPATFDRLVLMVQREVAERFTAHAGDDAYGSLSLEVQVHARARIAFRIGPGAFHPRPKVDSAVAIFDLLPEPDTGGVDPERFRQVVRAAFGQRRKTLRNSLGSIFGRDEAEAMLARAGIPATERAERLDREAFIRLARVAPAPYPNASR